MLKDREELELSIAERTREIKPSRKKQIRLTKYYKSMACHSEHTMRLLKVRELW